MVVAPSNITLACCVRPSPDALIQLMDNEAIVLDIASERYFGLNTVGARLWELLKANPALEEAHRRLLEEYDVAAPDLERDLIVIVTQLASEGLVSIG